ncbi:MAG TPA: hypothetical protein VHD60_01175 [Candidatus Saccharimonadales bacterium]|nr:hypothetical protein [Candidatus Saccharimonadales bacterium]
MAHFNRPSKWGKKERRFLASLATAGALAGTSAGLVASAGTAAASPLPPANANVTSAVLSADKTEMTIHLTGTGFAPNEEFGVNATGNDGVTYSTDTSSIKYATDEEPASKADGTMDADVLLATTTPSAKGPKTITVTGFLDDSSAPDNQNFGPVGPVKVTKATPPPVCKKDSDASSLAWYSNVVFKIGTTTYSNYTKALTAAKPGDTIVATGTANIPEGCTSNPFNALYMQPGATLQTQVLLDHHTDTLTGTGRPQTFSESATLPSSGTGEGQLCGTIVMQGDSGVGEVITDFHNGTYGDRKFANGYTTRITKDFGSCEQPPPPQAGAPQLSASAGSCSASNGASGSLNWTAVNPKDGAGTDHDTVVTLMGNTVVKEQQIDVADGASVPGSVTGLKSGTYTVFVVSSNEQKSAHVSVTVGICPPPVTPPTLVIKATANITFACAENGYATANVTVDSTGSTESFEVQALVNGVKWASHNMTGDVWNKQLTHVPDGATIVVNGAADAVLGVKHVTGCTEAPGPKVTPPTGTPQQPLPPATDGYLSIWQRPMTWFAVGGILLLVVGGYGVVAYRREA